VVGLILVLVAVLELTGTVSGRNVARDIALILAFVAAGIGVYQIVNLESRLGEVRSEFARASVGMGLYSVVGGWRPRRRRRVLEALTGHADLVEFLG
jgi:hypothetical protein